MYTHLYNPLGKFVSFWCLFYESRKECQNLAFFMPNTPLCMEHHLVQPSSVYTHAWHASVGHYCIERHINTGHRSTCNSIKRHKSHKQIICVLGQNLQIPILLYPTWWRSICPNALPFPWRLLKHIRALKLSFRESIDPAKERKHGDLVLFVLMG